MSSQNKTWSPSFRYVVGLFVFIGILALLIYAHEAVKALVIAAFVAYLISPIVALLIKNTKLSRRAAVNIVYFSSLIVLVGAPATLTPIFFDELKIVVQDVLNLSREISNTLSQPVQFGGIVFHFEQLGESVAHVQDAILTPLPAETLALLETTSVRVLWSLVIIVSVHLYLAEWPHMRELYKRVRRVWMAYLRGQIVLMLIVGTVFTVAWLILGIPGALVLGMLAGLFTLVPDVGPFVAVALAVGVALLEGSNWIPLPNFWVASIVVVVYQVLIVLKNF